MAVKFIPETQGSRLPLAIAVSILLAFAFLFRLRKKSFPKNSPALVKGLPVVGSWNFFTERWTFCQNAIAASKSNGFSFWVGDHPVVGLHGEEARKTFFETRELNMAAGYRVLLGGTPNDGKEGDPEYFSKRLVNMLKGGALRRGLPNLLKDIQAKLSALERDPRGITKPFDSIYKIVFQLTIRTVGCNEIADDPEAMRKMLGYFEAIESSGDRPLSIMYPWLWTTDYFKRLYAGARLYGMLNQVMEDRKKTGRRDDDAMQYLIDQGDDTMKAVEFILGALFAGQVNSGINASWLIIFLSRDKYWRDQVLSEIRNVVDTHIPPDADPSLRLRDKLALLPVEAWESGFPTLDLCLKDTIRLNLQGTAMRQNISSSPVSILGNSAAGAKTATSTSEVIPPGHFAIYPAGDAHLNPDIYPDPLKWDPARYLPDRAEDQKQKYGWFGWGVARHPCLGMRFAKLEMSLIVAFWFAYFDSENVDAQGNKTGWVPDIDHDANSAKKPKEPCYIRYRVRKD